MKGKEYKTADVIAMICNRQFYRCGERFSAKLAANQLKITQDRAATALREMLMRGLVHRHQRKIGTADVVEWQRRDTSLIRMPWRIHTDVELGIPTVVGPREWR